MNRHAFFVKLGLEGTPKIATQLLNSYVATQSPNCLAIAHKLFDQVPHKDTVLWSSLISAYARFNLPNRALELFSIFHHQFDPIHKPNHFVYATVAQAISTLGETHLLLGQTIYAQVVKYGFLPNNVVVGTAFLDMYAKCGDMSCAGTLFDEMPEKNLVTWNAMIAGCVHNEMLGDGLNLFYRMKCCEWLVPDEFSLSTMLTACGLLRDLTLGMQLHAYLIVSGFHWDCLASLCNMYFQCGDVQCAEKVCEGAIGSCSLDLIRIRGYVLNSRYKNAIECFVAENNIIDLLEVDRTIVVPLLTSCARLLLLRGGKQIHSLLVTLNCFSQSYSLEEDAAIIGCALIDMYSKCYSVKAARTVFNYLTLNRQVPLWNSMINGYVFNNLVNDAQALFEKMPWKTVVAFTSLMTGYVHNGSPREGLDLLAQMYSIESGDNRVEGNSFTFVVGLEACSYLTDLARGMQIHAKVIRSLSDIGTCNVILGTTLVDMYSKAGNLRYMRTVFNLMSDKNVIAWTSIITGYAAHGDGSHAIESFKQMIGMDVEPNEITFISVLTACSHCGLVDDGLHYFKFMKEKYHFVLNEDHYTCLIDMLGRVGRLDEAWKALEEIDNVGMGTKFSSHTIWAAMFGACQLHGDVEVGKRVASKIFAKGKVEHSSMQVTLSNVYAAAGLWDEAYEVRKNLKKQDGYVKAGPAVSRI